ncbi:hypothetical protein [uncultured Acetobacterium sp.]|uniref:hypothetical protein n=1 Tax=uncultured Acetobacterium sp. TaxID=217139 RepID=UPI0025CCCA45|nr:hypothetical protein [uncultured Acetobacterium sp.]
MVDRKYYMPKNKDHSPVDIRKVTPKTTTAIAKASLPLTEFKYFNDQESEGNIIGIELYLK